MSWLASVGENGPSPGMTWDVSLGWYSKGTSPFLEEGGCWWTALVVREESFSVHMFLWKHVSYFYWHFLPVSKFTESKNKWKKHWLSVDIPCRTARRPSLLTYQYTILPTILPCSPPISHFAVTELSIFLSWSLRLSLLTILQFASSRWLVALLFFKCPVLFPEDS